MDDKIRSFTDLNAWKDGHALVLQVYKLVKLFPRDENFGLISQMKRSSASVTANIAEGFSRQSFKEKVSFYFISLGSLTELQDQLFIGRDVGYVDKNDFDQLWNKTEVVQRLICGLIKSSKKRII